MPDGNRTRCTGSKLPAVSYEIPIAARVCSNIDSHSSFKRSDNHWLFRFRPRRLLGLRVRWRRSRCVRLRRRPRAVLPRIVMLWPVMIHASAAVVRRPVAARGMGERIDENSIEHQHSAPHPYQQQSYHGLTDIFRREAERAQVQIPYVERVVANWAAHAKVIHDCHRHRNGQPICAKHHEQ